MSLSVRRYVRAVQPRRFREQEPLEEHMGQSRRHLHLCMALYQMLRRAASPRENTFGADQYVYFRANDARRCLAPDAFVKLGQPDEDFDSWKSWERGAPDVAFEILSPSDTDEPWGLAEKVERYDELGVKELIVFNIDADEGHRLRAWDRVEGDFVERVIEGERTTCGTLRLYVGVGPVVVDDDEVRYPACVRFARDETWSTVIPTDAEQTADARSEAASARLAEQEARRETDRVRLEADARIAELEAELARRDRGAERR